MKKWGKIVSVISLGCFLGLGAAQATAKDNEYVYINDYALRDYLESKYERFASKELDSIVGELNQQLENGEITEQECDELTEKYEIETEEKISFVENFKLYSQDFMGSLESLSPDWDAQYSNLHGLEYARNLRSLSGEGDGITDIRPIRNLTNLEELYMAFSNQTNLTDLTKLENLKNVRLEFLGYGSVEEEEEIRELNHSGDKSLYTQTLLTDISALSDLEKLEKISISAHGIMSPVTLKKGTTNYQLYDPIIPSLQFNGADIVYNSYLENVDSDSYETSSEWLSWEGLTGEEEFLSFDWSIVKGSYAFYGEGQIPIRWK